MQFRLAQNIRRFRKEKKLSQEQLAEIMGVTLGAVYKWEAGQSIPDLNLIVEMADFFNTSVDVLIGYEWSGSSAAETLSVLKRFRLEKQYSQGADAARKALRNYPNHFAIVYESAQLFYEKAGLEQNRSDYEAALKQLERACELLAQKYLTKAFGKLLADLDSIVIGFTTTFWMERDFASI